MAMHKNATSLANAILVDVMLASSTASGPRHRWSLLLVLLVQHSAPSSFKLHFLLFISFASLQWTLPSTAITTLLDAYGVCHLVRATSIALFAPLLNSALPPWALSVESKTAALLSPQSALPLQLYLLSAQPTGVTVLLFYQESADRT